MVRITFFAIMKVKRLNIRRLNTKAILVLKKNLIIIKFKI